MTTKNNYLIFCISLLTILTGHAQQLMPSVSKGKIVRHKDFASSYVSSRTIDVWLPEGYNKSEKYAVLYMHDGQSLYDAETTWNKQEWDVDSQLQELIDSGQVRPTIVVGIFNSSQERHRDYFPQKPFESLPQKTQDSLLDIKAGPNKLFVKPIGSDEYLKFIVEEVKPFIDSTYSVKTDRENTFIAGSSMGGLISWYALCEYPEVFSGAACLSTHWPGTFTAVNNPIPRAFMQYLKQHLPEPGKHRIYFDYGTETLDALYEPFQLQADQCLRDKGYSDNNWKTLKFEGENHSETAWQKRLETPLLFLLKE